MPGIWIAAYGPPELEGDLLTARRVIRTIAMRDAAAGDFDLPPMWWVDEARADLFTDRDTGVQAVRVSGVVRSAFEPLLPPPLRDLEAALREYPADL